MELIPQKCLLEAANNEAKVGLDVAQVAGFVGLCKLHIKQKLIDQVFNGGCSVSELFHPHLKHWVVHVFASPQHA